MIRCHGIERHEVCLLLASQPAPQILCEVGVNLSRMGCPLFIIWPGSWNDHVASFLIIVNTAARVEAATGGHNRCGDNELVATAEHVDRHSADERALDEDLLRWSFVIRNAKWQRAGGLIDGSGKRVYIG